LLLAAAMDLLAGIIIAVAARNDERPDAQ